MKSPDPKIPSAPEPGARKRYTKPQLHVYGDFRDLTQSVGNMGQMDGKSGKFHSTQAGPWT